MSRRAQENLAAAVILGVFVGVIIMSLGYGPRARLIPLPLATIGILLTVIQIVWQNVRSTDELQVDLLQVLTRQAEKEGAAAKEGEDGPGPRQKSPWRKEAAALGIVAALAGLILLLGPIPAIFLFTGAYFLFSGHYSWLKGLVYTVAFTAAVYLLFVVALEVQLYHGILEPLVERFR